MMSLDAAIYRALIRLYPHGFWRTFHDELERDFEDGRAEVRAEGAGALVRFWTSAVTDLARSLGREWLRTPWIPVLCAAATLSIGLFAYTSFKVRQWPQFAYWPASRAVDTDADALQLIVLMVVGVLIPIVGTILGSLWMLLLRSNTPRRRRRV